jgi:hypothetical protein
MEWHSREHSMDGANFFTIRKKDLYPGAYVPRTSIVDRQLVEGEIRSQPI